MIKRLRDLGGEARKVHGSRYSIGEPDIDCVIWGVPLKVEVKVPGGKPTGLQRKRLEDWRAAGAVAGVVTSLEELDFLVEGAALRGNRRLFADAIDRFLGDRT
jgi:hypothetical protein